MRICLDYQGYVYVYCVVPVQVGMIGLEPMTFRM